MPNLAGQSIGRYHVLEQLGEGGMSTVYKAYDTRLERNVALKVIRTDLFGSAIIEQILKRFEREAKSLAKLSHSNIINILDFGEHEGMPYLVMEYLPGGTLKQKLGRTIPWQEAIRVLLPVARGLSYAHQHGVIHRDVKPANVLIDQNEEPILTDFGIAKLLEGADGHTLTASGVGMGTPEYMAPEQGIGAHSIDARADIYSLGIVLYEMITGRKPYIADTPMAVVIKHINDPLPRLTDFVPNLPEDVEHILFKALAKKPEDRYADMNAMIAAMEGVLTETKKAEATVHIVHSKKKAKSFPKLVIAIIGAMAVIGVMAVILVYVYGAPLIKQQFSGISEVTSTAKYIAPATSTFTLSPPTTSTYTVLPPTSTLELSPSPTLTGTPRSTPTNTPIPAWITDFAEPILAAIKDRTPDFQDDFSSDDPKGWFGSSLTKKNRQISIEEEVMRLEQGGYIANVYMTKKMNYVFQVEVSRPASCCVRVEIGGDNSIYLGSNEWGICRQNGCSNGNSPSPSFSEQIQVTVIVKNSDAGFYLMGFPVFHFVDRNLAIEDEKPMIKCSDNFCEFDNVKFWNLDNIKNLP